MFLEGFYDIDARYRYRYLWVVCGCLLLAAIVYASLTSSIPVPHKNHADKLLHAGSYLILMLWWLQLYPRLLMRLLLALMFIALGAGIEVLQSYHPLRYFDVADMIANALGVLLGLIMGLYCAGEWLLKVEHFFIRIQEH